MLSGQSGLNVVGQCAASEMRSTVQRLTPDIALVGVSRQMMKSEQWIRWLSVFSSKISVVMLGNQTDPHLIGELIIAGAAAYVRMESTREELISVVEKIRRDPDQVVLSVSRATLRRLNGKTSSILSNREREVLLLVAAGLRNSQIAGRLYLAEGTVKRHLSNIYSKLSVGSRMEAIKKAIALGLLSVDDILEPNAKPVNRHG
jgi:DNA-binding NarL/FixJ family response regulator